MGFDTIEINLVSLVKTVLQGSGAGVDQIGENSYERYKEQMPMNRLLHNLLHSREEGFIHDLLFNHLSYGVNTSRH